VRDFDLNDLNQQRTWLAGAHLVELHFVPDHPVYNTVTIDSVQITLPNMVVNGERLFP